MITIISPAKSLNEEPLEEVLETTIPNDLERSEALIKKLRKQSLKKLQGLMSISKNLAELNRDRYLNWDADFSNGLKPAVLLFNGDVYDGLQAYTLTENQLKYAQQHLRILSGLHGMLRPLDKLKPYRLEMGTSIAAGRSKNLYQYWSKTVTARLNDELVEEENPTVINLASHEYFKVVDTQKLKARVITPIFKDLKGDEYKVLSFFAKKARGMMARYIIENQISEPEQLKTFEQDGYVFNGEMSDDETLTFTRG